MPRRKNFLKLLADPNRVRTGFFAEDGLTPEQRQRKVDQEMREQTERCLYRELRKKGYTDEEMTAGRERLRAVMTAGRERFAAKKGDERYD